MATSLTFSRFPTKLCNMSIEKGEEGRARHRKQCHQCQSVEWRKHSGKSNAIFIQFLESGCAVTTATAAILLVLKKSNKRVSLKPIFKRRHFIIYC